MYEYAEDARQRRNVVGHEQPQSTTLMALSEDSFMYKFDSCGFRPDEVSVEERGDELIIEGRHSGKSTDSDNKSGRTFEKRVRVPEGIIPGKEIWSGSILCLRGGTLSYVESQDRKSPFFLVEVARKTL